jgi:hypothetical protein
MIGEARMAVDYAELALRKYWEKVATDDTADTGKVVEARVEAELAAAGVAMAETDLRQTLATEKQC